MTVQTSLKRTRDSRQGACSVDPDTDPPDEALGGSEERGVDEISGGPDDAGGYGGNALNYRGSEK